MFDQPGYRDKQREQTQLSIDALKADAEMRPLREQFERNKLLGDIEAQEWIQSDAGQKYTAKVRELGLTKLEEEIDYYKARSQALRNPQSTSGRTLKPPTVAEIEDLGATLALPRALTSKAGRQLNYASLTGESQAELVRESGYSLGQRFREMMPISIMAQTELEERIAAAWRGALDVMREDQDLSDAYQMFRKATIEGMRTGGFNTASSAGTQRNLFRINQWMNEQVRTWTTSGNLDWENFNKLSEDLKQKFYLKLPIEKRPEFKLRWHSYELGLEDPLKAK